MADTYFPQFLIPLIGLAISVISQVLALRFLKWLGVLRSFFAGFICGFLSILFMQGYYLFIKKDASVYLAVSNILIYFALGYCFFHFINLGETARRIRLLRELYDAPQGLTEEQILLRYNSEGIIKARLDRLLNNKQIILRGEKFYVPGSVMFIISGIIVFMKLMVMGKRSEFEN